MEVLVLGGDMRYIEVIEYLSCRYNVSIVGYKNTFINNLVKNLDINDVDISKYDVVILPINGVMDKNLINCRFNNNPIKLPRDFFVDSKDNVMIFSGIPTPNLDNMLEISNRDCIYMMKDKDVISENAVPTVEGIIADVINNTDKTLADSRVLVFGYGNIGSLLVKYLEMLGADVIVNTVPKPVISNNLIKFINPDCYVLDVASHPHGIDQEVLAEYFIKSKLYLGIPGKIAPKTSGNILSKKISSVMGD